MPAQPARIRIRRQRQQSLVLPLRAQRRAHVVTVGAGAELDLFLPLGGRAGGAFSVRVVLNGPGAQARIRGGGVLTGRRQLQLTVDTVHRAPRTTGSTLVKAVVRDRARFDFAGLIKIAKRAQGAQDFLQQDSLLLSDEAGANAVPALEIEADDVKASHAATVAPLNPDQLFYLRSRGISEAMATQLVAEAFLAPTLTWAPSQYVGQIRRSLST